MGERFILQAERGHPKMGSTVQMIVIASLFILAVQAIGVIIMTFWFFFAPAFDHIIPPATRSDVSAGSTYVQLTVDGTTTVPAYGNFGVALWWGIFHSVSASNNAGFDIMGQFSIAPYRNDKHVFIQIVMMIQFILGGIGFPVLFDIVEWIKSRRKKVKFRFSLFSKLALITYGAVAALVLMFNFIGEYATPFANYAQDSSHTLRGYDDAAFGKNPSFNRIWSIIFTSFSTRNAGYATISPKIFSPPAKWTQALAMIIGSSPSSTAGGIRTTTVAVAVIAMVKKSLGRKHTSIFKKTIPEKTIFSAYFVIFISVILVALSSLIISFARVDQTTTNGTYNYADVMYEVASAFGTTGLSTGLTPFLPWWALLNLIILMFVGQLGVSTWILSWRKQAPSHNSYKYMEEEVIVG